MYKMDFLELDLTLVPSGLEECQNVIQVYLRFYMDIF